MAKATGIVRRIDNLGRVVIPQSVRRSLGWTANGGANGGGTPLEIFVDDHCVTLREYRPGCALCANTEDLVEVHGKAVCPECIDALARATKAAS